MVKDCLTVPHSLRDYSGSTISPSHRDLDSEPLKLGGPSRTLESCEGNGPSPPCDVTSCASRVSATAHSVDHKVTEVVRTFLCQDMLCPGSSTAGPSHQGLPGRSRGGPRRPGCYRHRPAVRYKIRPGLNPGYRDISPQVSIRYYR